MTERPTIPAACLDALGGLVEEDPPAAVRGPFARFDCYHPTRDDIEGVEWGNIDYCAGGALEPKPEGVRGLGRAVQDRDRYPIGPDETDHVAACDGSDSARICVAV